MQRKLNAAQIREGKRRYQLYVENHPKRVGADLGINPQTLRAYVFDKHKPRKHG